ADALDDRAGARVAHAEALAGQAAEERLAAGGAVEHDVADRDVLLRAVGGVGRRADDERAAGEPLAGVVVGVAVQRERDAVRQPAAERLAGGAVQVDADAVLLEAPEAVPGGDGVRQDAADAAVDVADRAFEPDRAAV